MYIVESGRLVIKKSEKKKKLVILLRESFTIKTGFFFRGLTRQFM